MEGWTSGHGKTQKDVDSNSVLASNGLHSESGPSCLRGVRDVILCRLA